MVDSRLKEAGMDCKLIGVPVQDGPRRAGCAPWARKRCAMPGLARAPSRPCGHVVADLGDVARGALPSVTHANPTVTGLPEVSAWTSAISEAAFAASGEGHADLPRRRPHMSAGTLRASRRVRRRGPARCSCCGSTRIPTSTRSTRTTSGNLHGVPLAYATRPAGLRGFPAAACSRGRSDARLHDRPAQRRPGGARSRCAGAGSTASRHARHRRQWHRRRVLRRLPRARAGG